MAITKQELFDPMTDRYAFDFNTCAVSEGWAQVDTSQDASYFGTWAHPVKFQIVNYCEGDITVTKCDTQEEFVAEMWRLAEWNQENGYWLGVDPGWKEEDKEPWEAIGLGDMLH